MYEFVARLGWSSCGLLLGVVAGVASAQTCELYDLNTQPADFSSDVDGSTTYGKSMVELGGYWYFSGETIATGRELFRTDGTALGTSLVKDIRVGFAGSNPNSLTALLGLIWFFADDGDHGRELWVSDGTEFGTTLVADVYVGPDDAILGPPLWSTGNCVYFLADDGVHGRELWKTDGTRFGTSLVKDINSGPGSSGSYSVGVNASGTQFLFGADDGVNGYELWTSDGTTAGTQLLKDIRVGPDSSAPVGFVLWNGKLIFNANDGVHGQEPWMTDGTASGTTLLKDLASTPSVSSSSPDFFGGIEYQGELYFTANSGNGTELHKTDGTAAGTIEAVDVGPLTSSIPRDLTVAGGFLYFSADGDPNTGRELYRSNGTPGGTVLVKDAYTGTNDGLTISSSWITALGSEVFYSARSASSSNHELWRSDGTTGGTFEVLDLEPGPNGSRPEWLTPLSATKLLFAAQTVAGGTELYVTDGTAAGTSQVVELQPTGVTESSHPGGMYSVSGDYLLFSATDGVLGNELYRWDAATGITLLKDINPGAASGSPLGFQSGWFGGQYRTLFVGSDGVNGPSLWSTDGTPAGTQFLVDVSSLTDVFTFLTNLTYHPEHQRVYFRIDDGTHGIELWATDGTAAGTTLVSDIHPTGSSFPGNLTVVGSLLFFSARDPVFGTELFVTDGTAAGTTLVADVNPGVSSSNPSFFTEANGALAFIANDGSSGSELYRSDGTAAGTYLVADIHSGPSSSLIYELVESEGGVFFAADDGIHGKEPWRSDLTAGGTSILKDIQVGPDGSTPVDLVSAGGKLFFGADAGAGGGGQELWVSDGTTIGTTLVVDAVPGDLGSGPRSMLAANGGVYYLGIFDNQTRVMYSDGTAIGTVEVCNTYPGPPPYGFTNPTLCGDNLFFIALDLAFGSELFHVSAVGAVSIDLGLGATGAAIAATDPVLGGDITVSGTGTPPGSVGFFLMSAHTGAPNSLFVAPPNASWIDVFTLQILFAIPPVDWSFTQSIPAIPSAAGAEIHLQSWYLSGGLPPATTSNGLHLVLGS